MTAPRQYPRAERVRRQVKEVLAAELDRARDPGLGYVTITDVTMTPDLRNAKVYYTVLGGDVEHAATVDALKRAHKHLRAAVGREMSLRYVPEIEFVADPVPDRASRIDALLAELHRKEDD